MAARVEGTERGLDALVGLVIVITGVVVAAMAIAALYDFGTTATFSDTDAAEVGFSIAVIASIGLLGVTTLIYLVRIAIGRRSWTAPLWGLILTTIAILIAWLVMTSA